MKYYICPENGKNSDAVAACKAHGAGIYAEHAFRHEYGTLAGQRPFPPAILENPNQAILCPRCNMQHTEKSHIPAGDPFKVHSRIPGSIKNSGNSTESRTPVPLSESDLNIRTRELSHGEFGLAENLVKCHRKHADGGTDRIFAVLLEGKPVSIAWSRRHDDGLELHEVHTEEKFRYLGFARMALESLIHSCSGESLYTYSKSEHTGFYRAMGFTPIPEREMPSSIKERFDFVLGSLAELDICPMRYSPDLDTVPIHAGRF